MSDFSKTGLKSFFAYFNIVDKDNSGILEQDEIEGLSIFCKRNLFMILEVAKSMFGSGYEERLLT